MSEIRGRVRDRVRDRVRVRVRDKVRETEATCMSEMETDVDGDAIWAAAGSGEARIGEASGDTDDGGDAPRRYSSRVGTPRGGGDGPPG